MTPEQRLVPWDNNLNGRLRTGVDGTQLDPNDFKILKNFRYTDRGIKGIQGMTKINSSPASYTSVDNAFHFVKSQPAEDHLLVQTTSGSNSRLIKSDGSSAGVPSTETFSTFKALSSNNRVYFSKAPDGSMAVCDGYYNYIWSGSEYRCAKFINYASDASFNYDFTEQVTNNINDANNRATLYRVTEGVDANTLLLLHMDGTNGSTTFTDSSPTTAHTMSAHGNAQISTTQSKFGGASGSFDGTGDYIHTGDDADFDLSGANVAWTIDFWIYLNTVSGTQTIYYQGTDSDNYMAIYHGANGLQIDIVAVAATVVTLSTVTQLPTSQWTHVAFVENANSFYIFVDGALWATKSDTDRAADYTGDVYIGCNDTPGNYLNAYLDEFRLSDVARWTSDFNPLTEAYGTSASVARLYIGSTRPIQGVKFYVANGNASPCTPTGFYWNGSAWASVGTITDGTASGTATLATPGSMTFSNTSSTAKLKAIDNTLAYFYNFVFSGIDAGTTIYYVTLDCAIQSIVDIWDGVPRTISSCLEYTTSFYDVTTNVLYKDYDSTNTATYVSVDGLTTSEYLYVGSTERLMGVNVTFIEDDVNTTANTILTVSYWNGTAWTSVGFISDATSIGGISFAQSGIITWNHPGEINEYKKSLVGLEYYYYRLNFSQTLSTPVSIDCITAIPAQKILNAYRIPVLWQNRLWLLNEQSKNKNKAICSAYHTNCVFNGADSDELYFGSEDEIVAGCTLFTRYGGNIYENLIVIKKTETYLVDGYSPETYKIYCIADNVGIISPLTLKVCNLGFEVLTGITKHVAIWMTNGGFVMFDANTVIPISEDIKNYFDPSDTTNYINTSYVSTFFAFYDSKNKEYHALIATGSNTSLNKELVYDLLRRKWFEINRGTGKALRSGCEVQDSSGNSYCYGGTTDGYIERLEYGTLMDGNSIAYNFRTGDRVFNPSAMMETELHGFKLTAVAKTTTSETIAVTHYGDTRSTGTSISAINQNVSARRVYQIVRKVGQKAIFHCLDFSISTDDETIGFEPLFLSGLYKEIRIDTLREG